MRRSHAPGNTSAFGFVLRGGTTLIHTQHALRLHEKSGTVCWLERAIVNCSGLRAARDRAVPGFIFDLLLPSRGAHTSPSDMYCGQMHACSLMG